VWPENSGLLIHVRSIALKQFNRLTTIVTLSSVDSVVQKKRIGFGCDRSQVQFLAPASLRVNLCLNLFVLLLFCQKKFV